MRTTTVLVVYVAMTQFGCSKPLEPSGAVVDVSQTRLERSVSDSQKQIGLPYESSLAELARTSGLATASYIGRDGFPHRYLSVPEEVEWAFRADPIGTMWLLFELVRNGSVSEARTAGGLALALTTDPYVAEFSAYMPVDEDTRDFYLVRLPAWIEEVEARHLNERCGTVLDQTLSEFTY